MYDHTTLEDVGLLDDFNGSTMELPQILPRFFVPPLADKPQNPIMDTIKLTLTRQNEPLNIHHLPPELRLLATDPSTRRPNGHIYYNLWLDAATRNPGIKNKALSWDRLRPSHPTKASSTGFLSEQDDLVFAAARYYVDSRLHDPLVEVVYVTQSNLLNALKMTVLGTSSVFHTWNALTEQFVQSNLQDNHRGFLLIDGMDEVVSQSFISRFLTIGTLLRRLEILLVTLRSRSAQEGPTVHAYGHALSTVITFIRSALARGPPIKDPLSVQKHTLSATWIHYEIYEEILVALADMYGRHISKSPQEYPLFNPSPAPLLSHIYFHLNTHLECHSRGIIKAIFAFILTTVSREYLQQVSRSVGYGANTNKHVLQTAGERLDQYPWDEDEENKEDNKEDNITEPSDSLWDTLPDFFPPELVDILPAAQKSLVLLQTAQPDHPLLQRIEGHRAIKWFWTHTLIEAAWNGTIENRIEVIPSPPETLQDSPGTGANTDFSLFDLFDLEPGSNLGSSTAVGNGTTSIQLLTDFIDSFPEFLPPITPSLAHLTSLILEPLVRHASTLSNALLTLFLTPSTPLNFQAHLHLLRSYLLLTAPPFKSRLTAALFSDSEDSDYEYKPHSISIRSLRHNAGKKAENGMQPWAVGLAPSLLERETWPPVGADLSFFLRTVIVDSFETGKEHPESDRPDHRILEEAEYRLGFAIRDLPVGPGRDKWLNPLSIEALDFLYMDYKPPLPLEVLITPEILSKYQRMFAFILRLMRVESAINALFRMTRMSSNTLFPTLVQPRKLLLHFRFVAHSFVSSLSGYVFDTAIRGNFDPFLARLSPSSPATFDGRPSGFSDVFALATSHSILLDDILSACLLRSGQRTVGDLLRHSLELVLEYIVAVGELHRGRMEEYQAAPLLQEISQKFYTRMKTFIKVLKGLVDKNGPSAVVSLQNSQFGNEPLRKPTGGADALYHLLIRLDLGDWWIKKHSRCMF